MREDSSRGATLQKKNPEGMSDVWQHVLVGRAVSQFTGRCNIPVTVFEKLGLPIHEFGEGLAQYEEASVHKPLEQHFTRGIDECREQEQPGH